MALLVLLPVLLPDRLPVLLPALLPVPPEALPTPFQGILDALLEVLYLDYDLEGLDLNDEDIYVIVHLDE